ncbi:unnamed protein product [Psylliodes chrysocephalus]|uniref:Chitin-binding type-2 domain-containing protein n=1 Tax=Psylliodes chrysocephalus TaxID=3402493 RepID=A0A9P0D3V4_9CUCU|nr:unnamed protein product [Psylliodes chrysocephala]
MDNMTLTVIFLILGVYASSSTGSNLTNIINNQCLEANVVCPAVDGPDSVYGALPDCTKFCQCSNGVPILHTCPQGLHFNPLLNVCDWPSNAGCTGRTTQSTTTTTTTAKSSTPKVTTTERTTTPKIETTTPNICVQAGITCPAVDGPDSVYGALPDCTKFCQCSNGAPYVHTCPAGLHFNPILNVCDWPSNAGCTGGTTQSTTTQSTTTTTKSSTPKVTTTERTTTPKTETTTPNICVQAGIICPAVDGPDSVYGALPDCTKFCQCSNGAPYVHTCPSGLHFNPILNVCDWPSNAGCTGGTTQSTTTQRTTTTAKSSTPKVTTTEGTTTERTTTPKTETTTPNICVQAGIICPAVDGPDSVYGALPDCTKFCQCSNGAPYVHTCPSGLHFNPILNVCDWPSNAGCTGGTTQSTTTQRTTTTAKSSTPKVTTTEGTTTERTTTPKTETTTPNICVQAGISCPAVDGPDSVYGALPDCTKFCQCSNGVPILHTCPSGLHFNPVLNVCDWPSNAGCTGGTTQSTTKSTTTTTAKSTTTTAAKSSTPKVTTTESTTTQNTETSTANICINSNITCPSVDGPDSVYGALPDCTSFCQCSNGVPIVHTCPSGLHFNPILNVCDWPSNAGCTGGTTQSTTTQSTTTTTAKSSTPKVTTTERTTTQDTETTTANLCVQAGIICPAVDGPDSVYGALPDCTKFCQCSNGVAYVHKCTTGLHFNPILNVCDWPSNAGCTGGTTQSTTTQSTTTTTTQNETTSTEASTDIEESTTENSTTENENSDECSNGEGSGDTTTDMCQVSTTEPNISDETTENNQDSTTEDNIVDDTTENSQTTTDASIPCSTITVTETIITTTVISGTEYCLQNNVACPAADGPDSVYGTLPDCTKFCQCSSGKPYLHSCPDGLHFNSVSNVCEIPEIAGCASQSVTNPTDSNVVIEIATECSGESSTTDQESTTEDSTTEDSTTEDSTTEDSTTEDSTTEHSTTEDSSTEDSTTEDSTTEDSSTEDTTTEDSTTEDSTTEDSTTEESTTTTTAKSSTPKVTTTERTTTPKAETTTPNICVQAGIICPAVDGPDSVYGALPDCTKFCQCSNGVPIVHKCPAELHFNPLLNVCDWPSNAGCTGGTTQSTTTQSTTTTTTTQNNTSTTTVTTTSTEASTDVEESTTENSTTERSTPNVTTIESATTTIIHESSTPNVESTTTQNNETTPNLCVQADIKCPAIDPEFPVFTGLPDCTKYCKCSNGTPYLFNCPANLHFNPEKNVCDWPEDAGCASN